MTQKQKKLFARALAVILTVLMASGAVVGIIMLLV
jgi:hypothetical protein